MDYKFCPKCKTEHSTDFFHKANRRDGLRSWCKACERQRLRDRLDKLKALIYEKLGDACIMCGYADKRALQIDHVRGGGNKEHDVIKNAHKYLRKVIEDTEGTYQMLCANCNWIKRHERLEVVKEYNLSEEGRKKISEGRKSWVPSDETRKRMSDSHLGQSPDEEHREKLRQGTANSWNVPEVREARLAGMKAAKERRAEEKELVLA